MLNNIAASGKLKSEQELIKEMAQAICDKFDGLVFQQLTKIVCYDDKYIKGLCAFTGWSYKKALESLQPKKH